MFLIKKKNKLYTDEWYLCGCSLEFISKVININSEEFYQTIMYLLKSKKFVDYLLEQYIIKGKKITITFLNSNAKYKFELKEDVFKNVLKDRLNNNINIKQQQSINDVLNKLENPSTELVKNLLDRNCIYSYSYKDIIDKILYESIGLDKNNKAWGIDVDNLVEILKNKPFNFHSKTKFINNSYDDEQNGLLKFLGYNDSEINIITAIINDFLYNNEKESIDNLECNYTDIISRKITLDPVFEDDIMHGLSPDFNDLEKILFIYKSICQKLIYDEEYFAGNQYHDGFIKHKNINRVKKIDGNNNIVACYEAAAILAYFCTKLGIKHGLYSVDGELQQFEYGKIHFTVMINVGDMYFEADPTSGMIDSDLANEKVNGKVNMFYLLNDNSKAKDEFFKSNLKVEKYMEAKRMELGYNLLNENIERCKSISEKLSNREKLLLLFKEISKSKLSKMDNFRYFLDLRKAIFKNESYGNIDIYFLSHKEDNNVLSNTGAAVITFNENFDVFQDSYNNEYYLLINNNIVKTSKSEIAEMFQNEELKIIKDYGDINIPGIFSKDITIKKARR